MQEKPTLKLKATPAMRAGAKKTKRKGARRGAKPHQKQPFGTNSDSQYNSQNSRQDRRAEDAAGKTETVNKAELDSRSAAFHILNAIINHHKTLDAAMAHQPALAKLENRDRAFCRLLVSSCLRHYGQIGKILSDRLDHTTPEPVMLAIVIGACQLLFLNISAHAAVNTTVELVRALEFPRQAGLANAVMRELGRRMTRIQNITDPIDNIPETFQKRWRAAYGDEAVRKIAELVSRRAPLDITARHSAAELARTLKSEQIGKQTVRCHHSGDIVTMPGFEAGEWWVQDIAAALPAQLMGDVEGKDIFDICAAPGGKTAQLIAAGAQVTAIDNDQDRLDRLSENLTRLNMTARIICSDVLSDTFADALSGNMADGILLDAPCSATGTIRRRPDLLIRKADLDITELAKIQAQMVEACLAHLKPQGVMVYATCSLQPEEGEHIAAEMLSRHKDRLAAYPFEQDELGVFASALTDEGWARILPSCLCDASTPHKDGNDGFFIARFHRL